MSKHTDGTPARKSRTSPKPLTRLAADEISRRIERRRPLIARVGTGESDAVSSAEATAGRPDADGGARLTAAGVLDEARQESGRRSQDRTNKAVTGPLDPLEVRQMVLWETATDAEVISGWVLASTREDRRGSNTDTDPVTNDDSSRYVASTDAAWCIRPVVPGVDPAERRARLRQLSTRDDPFLVQRVSSVVVDLVMEHPHFSDEADRRLTALGIRFAVWTLNKSRDGEFDPFRDLTEDRITGFVREVQGLSPGSRDSYAAALRRLAAGPTLRHRGARRMAVEPLPPRVEDGLWAAADGFAAASWRHREAKTLLALSFGAGALAEEINLMAPEDVLVDTTHGQPRVTVRLLREKTWVRDVPVLEPHYAAWLARRAAQVADHTYLFKPDRVNRRNALNATTKSLAEANQAFERFQINAARNTWAVRWLQAGVPFAAWANAAGVGPGTHLPTDLLAYLPTPAPTEVDHAFRHALAQVTGNRADNYPGSAPRVPMTSQPDRSAVQPAAADTSEKA